MASSHLVVSIHTAWWLRYAVMGLRMLVALRIPINLMKAVEFLVNKGITVKAGKE